MPLAYVVRKDTDVSVTKNPEGGYATIQDDRMRTTLSIVAGVRVSDLTYLVNREKVWEIIARITREQTCWTYVKPAQRTRDGRMA
jgi:hypothetical protein